MKFLGFPIDGTVNEYASKLRDFMFLQITSMQVRDFVLWKALSLEM